MILSESNDVNKIYLISEDNSVINYFKEVVGVSYNIFIEPRLPEKSILEDMLCVLDSSMLENQSSDFLTKLEEKTYPVLCLVNWDLSITIRHYVENQFKYLIPFPAQTDFFVKYINDMYRYVLHQKSGDFNYKISRRNYEKTVEDSLFGYFLGQSELMKDVRFKIKKFAASSQPVLLLGETGTGKSTGADIIHKLSKRNYKEMQSLNISTINDSLACSTFFGTTIGAFTDARDTKGFFSLADGGTLFLDEMGVASNSIQAMLLTVIETGKFRRVGSENFEKTDVRLIFATNENPEDLISVGRLRKDFYCRISGNIIVFPPLRDRKEDIDDIVKAYLGCRNKKIASEAMKKLKEYDWPGNIRELHQCLERAILFSSGDTVFAEDIEFSLFSF